MPPNDEDYRKDVQSPVQNLLSGQRPRDPHLSQISTQRLVLEGVVEAFKIYRLDRQEKATETKEKDKPKRTGMGDRGREHHRHGNRDASSERHKQCHRQQGGTRNEHGKKSHSKCHEASQAGRHGKQREDFEDRAGEGSKTRDRRRHRRKQKASDPVTEGPLDQDQRHMMSGGAGPADSLPVDGDNTNRPANIPDYGNHQLSRPPTPGLQPKSGQPSHPGGSGPVQRWSSRSPKRREGPDGTPFGSLPKKKGGLAAHFMNTYKHIKAEQDAGHRSKGILEKTLGGWQGKKSNMMTSVPRDERRRREPHRREDKKDKQRARSGNEKSIILFRPHPDSWNESKQQDDQKHGRIGEKRAGDVSRGLLEFVEAPDIHTAAPTSARPPSGERNVHWGPNPFREPRSSESRRLPPASRAVSPTSRHPLLTPSQDIPACPFTQSSTAASNQSRSDTPEEHDRELVGEAASYADQSRTEPEQRDVAKATPMPSEITVSPVSAMAPQLPPVLPPPPPPPPPAAEVASRAHLVELLVQIQEGTKLRKVNIADEESKRSTAASPVSLAEQLDAVVRNRRPTYEETTQSLEVEQRERAQADAENDWGDYEPRTRLVSDRQLREVVAGSSSGVFPDDGHAGTKMFVLKTAQAESESRIAESRASIDQLDLVENEIFSTFSAHVGSPSWTWSRLGKSDALSNTHDHGVDTSN